MTSILEAEPVDPAHAEPLEHEKRVCARCFNRGDYTRKIATGSYLDAEGRQVFASINEIRDAIATIDSWKRRGIEPGIKFRIEGRWLCPICDVEKEPALAGANRAARRGLKKQERRNRGR